MGTKGKVPWRLGLNILFVFLVSGLWHGAYWTFIIFGGLHGIFFVFSLATKRWRQNTTEKLGLSRFPRLDAFIDIVITFHLVCFALIFFRAQSVSDAFYIIRNMLTGLEIKVRYGLGLGLFEMSVALVSVLILGIVEFIQDKRDLKNWFFGRPFWVRWSVYYAMVLALVFFGQFSGHQFIYFQF